MPLTHAQELLQRAVLKIGLTHKKKRMSIHELILAAKRQSENDRRKNDPMYKLYMESKKFEMKLDARDNAPLRPVPLAQFREFQAKSKKLCDITPYASSSEDEASGSEADEVDDDSGERRTIEIKRDPSQQAQRRVQLEQGRRRLAAARGRALCPDVLDSSAAARGEVQQVHACKVPFLFVPQFASLYPLLPCKIVPSCGLSAQNRARRGWIGSS
jgi:hypothetical protein